METVVPASNAGTEAAAAEDGSASVGVLGWLGFIIINAAAVGLISAGTAITWALGFGFSLAYTVALGFFAWFLDSKGPRFRRFVNLLWVLACIFIFVCGLYLSINVIGKLDNPDDGASSSTPAPPVFNDDLSMLLPSNSSEELKDWASQQRIFDPAPTFAAFAGQLFFQGSQGSSSSNAGGSSTLLRSDVGTTAAVEPALQDPYSFTVFDSRLFFSASAEAKGRGIWVLDAADAASGSPSPFLWPTDDQQGYAGGLFVDAASASLFFQAQYYCNGVFTRSILRSDGTADGTEDLRGACGEGSSGEGHGNEEEEMELPPAAELWGALFLAVVPMVAVAAIVLAWRKLHGLVTNVYVGLYMGALIIFLLLQEDSANLYGFLKWSITIYSSLCYAAIVVLSLLVDSLAPWQADLQSWAVVLVGGSFFAVIHFDLEVPFTGRAYAWVVYSLLAALQMAISVLVRRSFPMVCGAISAFVVAWKIADEIVGAVGGGWSSDVRTVSMFGLLALQGAGIIAASVLYANRRAGIEGLVRSSLLRCRKQEAREALA